MRESALAARNLRSPWPGKQAVNRVNRIVLGVLHQAGRGTIASMKPKPIKNSKVAGSGIDAYLAALPDEKRAALEKLRSAIKAAAPKAEECISYQIPGFRLGKRLLVSFGAAAKHCSFYPGAYPVEAHKAELKAYGTSKGTIRFPADSPLPAALVRKLVKTRIAQHARESQRSK